MGRGLAGSTMFGAFLPVGAKGELIPEPGAANWPLAGPAPGTGAAGVIDGFFSIGLSAFFSTWDGVAWPLAGGPGGLRGPGRPEGPRDASGRRTDDDEMSEIALILLSSMVRRTPWVRDWTEVEIVIVPAAANRAAASRVDSTREGARATGRSVSQRAESIADGTATPRRSSRAFRSCRPRESRPLTVPIGHESSRAASSCDLPSRWQSTIGSRYLPGSRASSSWSKGRTSSSNEPSGAGSAAAAIASASAVRYRDAVARARWAVR